MTRTPEDRLTPQERDALREFDDRLHAELAPASELERGPVASMQGKETSMSLSRALNRPLAAAGLVAAFVGLGTLLWHQFQQEKPGRQTDPAPKEQEANQRPPLPIQLVIALEDHTSSKTTVTVERLDEHSELRDYVFDLETANRQRQAALAKGKKDPQGYRDGTRYQLKDEKGRPLPIFWLPWSAPQSVPELERCRVLVSEDQVVEARQNALANRPYEPKHIAGLWTYEDPRWFGGDKPGFTAAAVCDARGGVDQWTGGRVVQYRVRKEWQRRFYRYTKRHVGRPMALVVGGEIWTAPRINEALMESVQISGGVSGFSEAQQTVLLRALQGRPK